MADVQTSLDLAEGAAAAEYEAELAAVRRLLDLSAGAFSLSVIVCPDEALVREAAGVLQAERPGLAVVAMDPAARDIFDDVSAKAGGAARSGLIVLGLPQWVDAEHCRPGSDPASVIHRVRSLNATRELWPSAFACPVLFWIDPPLLRFLPVHAQDWWRYVSHRFWLAPPRAAKGQSFAIEPTAITDAGYWDVDLAGRIAELESRLNELPPTPGKQLAAHACRWCLELGDLLRAQGRFDLALTQLDAAARDAETLGRTDLLALVRLLLGQLHQDRGSREEAAHWTAGAVDLYRQLAAARPEAFRPDLAMSCGTLGTILAAGKDHTAAKAAFEEGIHALAPLFAALPAAHASLMRALAASYARECEECGEPPDAELLAPVTGALARLQEPQEQHEAPCP
jgi:hypothetical protein